MIPIGKFEKIPRRQRLGKIQKIFAEAERNWIAGICGNNAAYADLALLLYNDKDFSPETRSVFHNAAAVLADSREQTGQPDESDIRRAFNTVRHVLLAETGRFPSDWDFINPGGILDPARRRIFSGMCVYLEDIRSPYNVGSMFRTAESFGVQELFLSAFCADPNHPRAERTAMGCVQIMAWRRASLDSSQSEAAAITGPFFALETGGIPLDEFSFPTSGVMIIGNEELGVSPPALSLADSSLGRVSIPSYGAKASLNASAAFAIAVQAWAKTLA
jgi:TrmH family RNA methyltransferase